MKKACKMIKKSYVKYTKGHRDSKNEPAPWVIMDHDTDKILSSHKTKEEAESHLRDMKIHGSFNFSNINDLLTRYGAAPALKELFEIHVNKKKTFTKEQFEELIKLDPTYQGGDKVGSYTLWLLKIFKENPEKISEDDYKAEEYLTIFDNVKKYFSGATKNIDTYKSLPELFEVIKEYRDMSEKEVESDSQLRRRIQKEKDNINIEFENEDWKIIIPNSYEASCYWGAGTEWCTATRSTREYFDKYNVRGDLYIIINKNDPQKKYQYHYDEGLMDIFDSSVKEEEYAQYFDLSDKGDLELIEYIKDDLSEIAQEDHFQKYFHAQSETAAKQFEEEYEEGLSEYDPDYPYEDDFSAMPQIPQHIKDIAYEIMWDWSLYESDPNDWEYGWIDWDGIKDRLKEILSNADLDEGQLTLDFDKSASVPETIFRGIKSIERLITKFANIKNIELSLPIPDTLIQILSDLQSQGKTTLIVGGAVRDAILGMQSKDIDIEVYGLDLESLLNFLNKYGKAHIEGKSFGVIKLKDTEGNDYDFSVPRKDSKAEDGQADAKGRGIQVELDINMTPEEAARRRDFTFNTLGYDPIKKELHNYFGGVEDLQNKIIRAVDPETFTDDPLRVLRGMQFAARFGMDTDPETAALCKSLKDIPLQQDRVRDEWMKFFTKCTQPSKGLQFLIDTEWIDNYPELKGIVGVPQDPEHHPEGTADIHTSLTMDAASRIADEKGYVGEDKAILVAAAMCHDLGKATTTDTSGEKITSYGHHEVGVELTEQLLSNIGVKKDVIKVVVPLVGEHMSHVFFDPSSKKSTIMHLAERLNDATIEQLEVIIRSDMEGRPPKPIELPEAAQTMIDLAKEKGVYQGKAENLISGKDLLSLSPTITGGKDLGDILRDVRDKQLRGEISTKEEALVYADKLLKKHFGLITGGDVVKALGGEAGPIIGEVLQEAWNAQLRGEITNESDALYWLYEYTDSLKIEEEPEILPEE